MSDPLIPRLKSLIISTLRLEDIAPEDIVDDAPLFGSGLSLDSIDALELVVQIEKDFSIKIGSSEESRSAFASVTSLAKFIRERAPADKLPN